MATTFSGTLKISLTGSLQKTANRDGPISLPVSFSKSIEFTNGTGANQANMLFSNSASISGSGAADLDLAGGLTDAFGDTITFTAIKAIIIESDSANGDVLKVGGDATAAFDTITDDVTDEILVRPGGVLALLAPDATGYAVTATTADILQITNADGSAANYDIIIIGEV